MDRTNWDIALTDKGVEQSLQLFKGNFLRAQEFSVRKFKISGKEGRRPACLSKDSDTGG